MTLEEIIEEYRPHSLRELLELLDDNVEWREQANKKALCSLESIGFVKIKPYSHSSTSLFARRTPLAEAWLTLVGEEEK